MAQVVPMEEMNLHFTGDFHAINQRAQPAVRDDRQPYLLGQQPRHRRAPHRVAPGDGHERPALRDIVVNLGGVANGFPRQTGFDITVASEVMAILCLSKDLEDLQKRLGDIVVAYTREKKPVYCRDLKADGAMTVLLKDAMQPNLVQTLENNPPSCTAGPSPTSRMAATRDRHHHRAEAGRVCGDRSRFRADLGAEKFFDIKCRKAGLKPAARSSWPPCAR